MDAAQHHLAEEDMHQEAVACIVEEEASGPYVVGHTSVGHLVGACLVDRALAAYTETA